MLVSLKQSNYLEKDKSYFESIHEQILWVEVSMYEQLYEMF